MIEFGKYPLYYTRDEEGIFQIAAQSQADAESCGVVESFTLDKQQVMQARAYAHGYELVDLATEVQQHVQD